MTDELNLTLPERERSKGKASKSLMLLALLVLLVSVIHIGLTLRNTNANSSTARKTALSPAALKELALKLEKQGMPNSAISLFKEYLSQSHLSHEQSAKIWYRIGTLHQESGNYEKALEAYYRSEKLHKVPALETEIGRRVQESLEAAGKFSALRYELKERVSVDKASQKEGEIIVAEIGPQKITKADLERFIEEQIERRLLLLEPYIPQDELKKQKQDLLNTLSKGQERLRLLNQRILEEILARKAREDKLTETPEVRAMLRDTERSFLASHVMAQELAGKIQISEEALLSYYEAHEEEYLKDQMTFAEARSDIYSILRQEKERELQGELLTKLKERYDVVIHMSEFKDKQEKEDGK